MKVLLTIILITISLRSFSQGWKVLNDSLIYYYNNTEYKKAIRVGEKAILAVKKQFGATNPEYANSINILARVYKNMGQYEKAEPLFILSKEIRKSTLGETDLDYASSLNSLAILYMYMGQYEKAEPLYIESKEICRKMLGETHRDYATNLNNLALLYHLMGQLDKAEPLYNESIEIRKNVLGETHPEYATSLNNLAGLYQTLGQYERAESLYVESKEIRKYVLGQTHPDYAGSLNNLAELYKLMGEYEKAEPLYIESMEIRKYIFGENHPDYAASLNNLGLLYQSMEEYEKAEPLYIESNEIRKNVLGKTHPEYAEGLNNLALLYKATRQYKKAEALYIESKKIMKNMLGETHLKHATILENLAALYESMGRYEKAEQLYFQHDSIILLNLLNNFTILSEKEKNNYLENTISMLESNNSFVYNNKKASHLFLQNNFNQQLVFKSLTLADTRIVLTAIRQSRDTAIQRLFNNWQINKRILAQQYSLSIISRREDLNQLAIKTESMEKELIRKSSAFRKQQSNSRISWKDVQKKLQPDEAAIEFVRFRLYNKKWTDSTIYAAYLLQKDDPFPVFIPLCEEKKLQQLFDSAGNTSTSRVSKFYRGLEVKNKNVASLGKELYQLVWYPLEPYLKGVKKISYSPAGKLYNIAFQALPVDSTTALMDKYQLQQFTSTRQVALRTKESQITKPTDIALFGNASFTMDSMQLTTQKMNQPVTGNVSTSIYTPQKGSGDNTTWNNLPGTAEEVNKIKQLFDKNGITTTSFIQTTASEENLKALSGNSPQILHIATHGFFLSEPDKKRKENSISNENTYTLADDPLLRSGLILAGGNYAWSGNTPIDGVEDGIATAYEISQLNLSNTELVVLSACETALGDVKGSEGVFGLQRAFKMAGVKKMIVSLWQVPDKETAELMTAFYTYWMTGKTINDAFTQAQAELRKKYAPFYWAAFVLVE